MLPKEIEELSKTIEEVKVRDKEVIAEFNSLKTKLYYYLSSVSEITSTQKIGSSTSLDESSCFLQKTLEKLTKIGEFVLAKLAQIREDKAKEFKSPIAFNEAMQHSDLPLFNPYEIQERISSNKTIEDPSVV